MGILDHLFDSDYRQREDIEELREQVSEAARDRPADTSSSVRTLRKRVDQLELMLEALYAHMENKGDIDREKLSDLMIQVDLADGVEDGRIGGDRTKRAPQCTKCSKPVSRKRAECVWCGEPVDKKAFKKRGYRR